MNGVLSPFPGLSIFPLWSLACPKTRTFKKPEWINLMFFVFLCNLSCFVSRGLHAWSGSLWGVMVEGKGCSYSLLSGASGTWNLDKLWSSWTEVNLGHIEASTRENMLAPHPHTHESCALWGTSLPFSVLIVTLLLCDFGLVTAYLPEKWA